MDSIRGIASLYVVIAHCRGLLWIGGRKFLELNPIESWAWDDYFVFGISLTTRLAVEFVIIFFVLSGFSIAHSLTKSQTRISFYKKRILRIYPPYVLALVWAGVVFVFTKYLHPEFYKGVYDTLNFSRYTQMNDFFKPLNVLKNLFYMPMEGFLTPFWSLTHEIIFYILAPFLFMKRKFYYVISTLLFLIHLIFNEFYTTIKWEGVLYDFFFVYNFFFFIGILFYNNFNMIKSLFTFLPKYYHLLMIFGAIIATYFVNIFLKHESVWSYLPSALFSVLLILYFIKYQIKINFLMFIGKFSYTLYITHVASIFLYHSLYYTFFNDPPPYIYSFFVFIPAIIFTLIIAYLQYEIVEKRSKKVIDKIRNA